MLKIFLYVEYSSLEYSSLEYSSQEDSSKEEKYKAIYSVPFCVNELYTPIIAYKWHTQLQKQWYVVINFASYYIKNNV